MAYNLGSERCDTCMGVLYLFCVSANSEPEDMSSSRKILGFTTSELDFGEKLDLVGTYRAKSKISQYFSK